VHFGSALVLVEDDIEHHSFLDEGVPSQDDLQGVEHFAQIDVGEITEAAKIDADDGDRLRADAAGRSQDRSVAPEDDEQIYRGGELQKRKSRLPDLRGDPVFEKDLQALSAHPFGQPQCIIR